MQALVILKQRCLSGRHAPGFTLAELLVTIAVIGLLASLLLPVLITARDRIKTTACSNNIKQVTAIALVLAGDLDGKLPPSSINLDYMPELRPAASVMNVIQNFEAGRPLGSYWVDSTAPWSKTFLCPADVNKNHRLRSGYAKNISYGNSEGPWLLLHEAGEPITRYRFKPLPIQAVRRPAQTAIFIEHDNMSAQNDFQIFSPGNNFTNAIPTENPRVDSELMWGNSNLPLRHEGGRKFNCAFLDGHASAFTWPAYPTGLLNQDVIAINQ